MRKLFTVILGISVLACLSIFAERRMYVKHKTDGVLSFKVGEVDSIYFSKTDVDDERDCVENGALVKVSFQVSDDRWVYFSQGNLQFNAMQGKHATADGDTLKGTWRFAEKQYDYVGESNGKISSTYDGWIDLFGWGTSGWNSGATAYQPWSKSKVNSDYYPGGSDSNDLISDYAKADWGVYNAISNGGDEPGQWRTLTEKEWEYLFCHNKWTLGYIKKSEEDYVLCYFLVPDELSVLSPLSTGTWKTTGVENFTVPSTNEYTIASFKILENWGVVALPVGGRRYGTTVDCVGLCCSYWSSSAYDSDDAYRFRIESDLVYCDSHLERYYGGSVRLVQEVP